MIEKLSNNPIKISINEKDTKVNQSTKPKMDKKTLMIMPYQLNI